MGLFSVARKIFGGSKSDNKYAKQINSQFGGWADHGTAGMGQAAGILGLGGPEQHDQAMGDYWDSSGGKFLLGQGMEDVDAFYRAKGLGQSGAAMKGIEELRSNLASTKLDNYLGNIFKLNQQALGAGGLVTSAGQRSTNDSGGLGKFIGALFASDPRLKTNVEKVGEHPDGLGVYDFDYLPIEGQIAEFMPEGRQRGVMADEVAQLRPWALGPKIEGYATVNYGAL